MSEDPSSIPLCGRRSQRSHKGVLWTYVMRAAGLAAVFGIFVGVLIVDDFGRASDHEPLHREVIRPVVATDEHFLVHTVKDGNSLAVIAKSYGTTADHVRAINGLDDDALVSGQTIFVPTEGAIKVSWYGEWFNGRPMANTEPYHTSKLVVAHRYLPLGTCVELTNPHNGSSVVAEVKDRIAERFAHRWDVSPRIFSQELGVKLGTGIAHLQYRIVDCDDPQQLARR